MSQPVTITIYPFLPEFYCLIEFQLLKAKYHLATLATINFQTLIIKNSFEKTGLSL